MALYEKTEEEQVEAIKKWWRDNGMTVFIGIAIGIGLLIGWRWWQGHSEEQAQQASMTYESMLSELQQNKITQAEDIGSALLKNHSNSSYAILGALHLAHQDLVEKDIESSHARLQWVIEQDSSLSQLTHIARLRKAKLFLSQEKFSEAKNLLDAVTASEDFQAAYAELRGDIAVAEGEIEAAKTAYQEALDSEALSYTHRQWVEMKLDDLGTVEGLQLQAPSPFAVVSTPSTAAADQSYEIPTPLLTGDKESVVGTPSTTVTPLQILTPQLTSDTESVPSTTSVTQPLEMPNFSPEPENLPGQ